MRLAALGSAFVVVLAVACLAAGEPATVEVTYLANEGFLLAAGERRVLVDGLHGDGLPTYPALGAPHRERLETAAEPFAGIDVVLATHHHADHFDARAVARLLAHEPGAVFVSTPQAVERLRAALGEVAIDEKRVRAVAPREGERVALDFEGIRVEALNLHHGRGRGVDNLGFLVTIGGLRLLHVGDTVVTLEEIAPLALATAGIDVAFVPFWHLLDDGGRAMVERGIAPGRVVAMHLPASGAPPEAFGDPGGLEPLVRAIEARTPGAVAFRAAMDRRTLP